MIEDIENEEVEQVEEDYIEYQITTYPSDFTLWGLYQKWVNEEIVIPRFQRGFVWDIERASLLIDSFFSGLPVPNVFFYIDKNRKSVVIDGQQRLLSAFYFFEGYFGGASKDKRKIFKLKGLNKNHPLYEKTYEDIKDSTDGTKIRDSILRAMNILQNSPNDESSSIYRIFERLNTGSVDLSPQEIRNCVYRGYFNDVLFEINKNKNWRNVLGQKEEDERQKDIELILRIFAFADLENISDYSGHLKGFLSKYMAKIQYKEPDKSQSAEYEKYVEFINSKKDIFLSTCEKVIKVLGEKPFRPKGRLNLAILDSFMSSLIRNNNSSVDIKSKYNDFISTFVPQNFSTNSINAVRSRIDKVRSLL
ncbi:MAG TPA: DUF262 domain-containing protein [Chitinophagales bacterium]|nr:DUF262 domain-containing protein [Chitinophagales bacterium]